MSESTKQIISFKEFFQGIADFITPICIATIFIYFMFTFGQCSSRTDTIVNECMKSHRPVKECMLLHCAIANRMSDERCKQVFGE